MFFVETVSEGKDHVLDPMPLNPMTLLPIEAVWQKVVKKRKVWLNGWDLNSLWESSPR